MNTGKMPWKTAHLFAQPNTTIWRYMSRRVFLALITEHRLMFHQFKELQKMDAREGMIVPGFWESVLEHLRRTYPPADLGGRSLAEASLDRIGCFTYASCWNMAKHEDFLMWKAYAPRGIAIRTTVGKFTRAPQENGNRRVVIRSQKIVYADHWQELEERGYRHHGRSPGTFLNKLFLHTKRKAFSSEREIRFRISPVFPRRYIVQPYLPRVRDTSVCPAWFPVVLANLDWIEEVVAESSIPVRAASRIRRLLEQQNLRFRISDI